MILWYVLISYTAKIIENHWSPIYPKANKWKEGWAQLSFTATLPQNDVFQPRFLRSLSGKYLDVDGDDIHARNIPSIEDVLRHVYHMICLLIQYKCLLHVYYSICQLLIINMVNLFQIIIFLVPFFLLILVSMFCFGLWASLSLHFDMKLCRTTDVGFLSSVTVAPAGGVLLPLVLT